MNTRFTGLKVVLGTLVVISTLFALRANADSSKASGSARMMTREIQEKSGGIKKLVVETFAQVTVTNNNVAGAEILQCTAKVELTRSFIQGGERITQVISTRDVLVGPIAPGESRNGEALIARRYMNNMSARLAGLECSEVTASLLIVPSSNAGNHASVEDSSDAKFAIRDVAGSKNVEKLSLEPTL